MAHRGPEQSVTIEGEVRGPCDHRPGSQCAASIGKAAMSVVLGVDIGTSSSKGVLVGPGGQPLATATREHQVRRPHPGHVEMAAGIWWAEFVVLIGFVLCWYLVLL